MLFKNFFDYLIKERNYSENTVKAYKKDLNTFSNFCIAELKQNDIRYIDYKDDKLSLYSIHDDKVHIEVLG